MKRNWFSGVLYAVVAAILAGCGAHLPEYGSLGKGGSATETAEIRLVGKGFYSEEMGLDLEEMGTITFGKQYSVNILRGWTKGKGGLAGRRYHFTDKAWFRIPAGTYRLALHYRMWQAMPQRIVTADYPEVVTFEAGHRYKLVIATEATSAGMGKKTVLFGIVSVLREKDAAGSDGVQ